MVSVGREYERILERVISRESRRIELAIEFVQSRALGGARYVGVAIVSLPDMSQSGLHDYSSFTAASTIRSKKL